MVKLPRRQLLELGAAALVVGPSVVFSRTGFAAPKAGGSSEAINDIFLKLSHHGWLSTGNFTIKLAGMKETLPSVKSVDLGSIKLSPGEAPSYTYLKLELSSATDALKQQLGFVIDGLDKASASASKDAAKMTIKWAPEYTRQASASGKLKLDTSTPEMKWSVNLLGSDNKVALTYNLFKCIPEGLLANKAGESLITYKIGSIETVYKKPKKPALDGIKGESLKLELGSLGTFTALEINKTSAKSFSMSKAVYDWIDGTTETTTQKVAIKKIDAMTWNMKVQAKIVVTSSSPALVPTTLAKAWEKTEQKVELKASLIMLNNKNPDLMSANVKQTAVTDDAAGDVLQKVKFQDFHFTNAQLTSIDMPKLVTGSTAPVTQTLNFTIPAKG